MLISFFVPGQPAAQGSMHAMQHRTTGKVIVMAANSKKLRPWRSDVAGFAQAEGVRPALGPVHVSIEFYLQRPKAHFLRDKLRATAPVEVDKKPDVDKLARGILDALTGVAWIDDAQVSILHVSKLYTPAAHGPGARITLRTEDTP